MKNVNELQYKKAKEQVEVLKGFYGNLMAYLIVIPFLWWLNYMTTDFIWAIFPTLGWGIGLAAHGMCAFNFHPLLGKNWEERKIKEFMNKDKF